jgi:hypothetical protein
MILKCICILFLIVFASGCSSKSELVKPEGEWRRINPVNPVTNKFVEAEKEAKNGQ